MEIQLNSVKSKVLTALSNPDVSLRLPLNAEVIATQLCGMGVNAGWYYVMTDLRRDDITERWMVGMSLVNLFTAMMVQAIVRSVDAWGRMHEAPAYS